MDEEEKKQKLLEWLEKRFEESEFIFAKSMPDNPHYYTLRKDWNDKDFVLAVKIIRNYGYDDWFRGRKYISLNIGNWKYWTMGDPINLDGKPHTILINRAELKR